MRTIVFTKYTANKVLAIGTAVCTFGYVAIAVGLIFGALILGTARTPWVRNIITSQAFLGFALCEIMGLIALVFIVAILFI